MNFDRVFGRSFWPFFIAFFRVFFAPIFLVILMCFFGDGAGDFCLLFEGGFLKSCSLFFGKFDACFFALKLCFLGWLYRCFLSGF